MLFRVLLMVCLMIITQLCDTVWTVEPRGTRTDEDTDAEDGVSSRYPPRTCAGSHYAADTCDCDCNARPVEYSGCEWKVIFKAVKGNGRLLSEDLAEILYPINKGVREAEEITGNLPYTDTNILDNFWSLYIKRVKLELFNRGERQVWFYFDGTGNGRYSWFSKEHLIASSYPSLKDGEAPSFGITPNQPFTLTHWIDCDEDCGYLRIIEKVNDDSCEYEMQESLPYFLYSPYPDRCAVWSDPEEARIADRLVISVMVCDHGLDYFNLNDHIAIVSPP